METRRGGFSFLFPFSHTRLRMYLFLRLYGTVLVLLTLWNLPQISPRPAFFSSGGRHAAEVAKIHAP